MIRKLIVFCLLSFVFCLLTSKAYAKDNNFDISVSSTYDIQEDGITSITQNISIKNRTEFYYTPTYSVSIGFKDIEKIQAYNSDGIIPTTLDDKNPDNKTIKLSFQKRYTGVDKLNNFTLKFDTKDIAVRHGNIWEITIPGIAKPDDFLSYTSSITAPKSFGMPAIIKPPPPVKNSSKIQFSKDEIGTAGIYMLYGNKQYYAFTLKYNISNPNLFPVRTEIALPPQTNYQNVVINSFSLPPINVTRDVDGNWIGEYKLMPQQKETVIVKGIVEVLSNTANDTLTNAQFKNYTAPRKFWDYKDPLVAKAIQNLKTAEDVYKYTIQTLSYNYNKVATDNIRLGGKGALSNPKNSVCLEFTDLFVTLARGIGIPARSVEGFAYTQNSKLRPLSLVNDILHAWPEYYDLNQKKWIMVDPTWGKTTHKVDYFNSLDFEHVAFVVKGMDSVYPIPAGGYKFDKETKDVAISFAAPEEFKIKQVLSISDTFPNFSLPKIALQGTFTVKNTGNTSVSNLTANIKTSQNENRQFFIDYIPPGGFETITTSFSDVPFLTNGQYVITMQVGGSTYTKKVRISLIPDLQLLLFIGGIIGGSIIIAAITFRTGSILIQRRKR